MNATSRDISGLQTTVTAYTPAKINLTLHVLGARDDSYHNLHSLVIGVDLCDRVVCTQIDNAGVELVCSDASLNHPDNLASQAARHLARCCGIVPTLKIELTKHIPVGAGLGGGSSDAAATLRLCNDLWQLNLSPDDLSRIGAEIGSDIPLFFSLPVAVITGRGEQVEPVTMNWSGWVLLVQTGPVVSTTDVYHEWRKEDSIMVPRDRMETILQAQHAETITELLFNDLEPAVFRQSSRVAEVFQKVNRLSSGTFRVTGAGSILYQLFDHQEAAVDTTLKVKKEAPDVKCSVAAAPATYTQIYSEEETWKSQMCT